MKKTQNKSINVEVFNNINYKEQLNRFLDTGMPIDINAKLLKTHSSDFLSNVTNYLIEAEKDF